MYTAVTLNFNSIKVRLERFSELYVTVAPEFQFHKGTIRTVDAQRVTDDSDEISIP